MQLTSTMFVSVDGVYQGPGGPTEDTSGGFERGGWLAPHFDEDCGAFITEVFGRADAFLLGRRTYEIFAGFWPMQTDPADPVASRLNALPKYVPSTTLRDPAWSGTEVLVGDVAARIRALKAQDGRELQVHGSGQLVRYLLGNDLLDQLNLFVFPVIVGQGRRLFPDDGTAAGLALDLSRATRSGVTISVYHPTGPAEFGARSGIALSHPARGSRCRRGPMDEMITRTLDVPGATLTYDVRTNQASTLPRLLIIGSPMGAAGFVTQARHFADRSVVTYDPRGAERAQSRSSVGIHPGGARGRPAPDHQGQRRRTRSTCSPAAAAR